MPATTPTATTPEPEGAPPKRLPPQATMGLLDYLTATALDEDYAHVSMQRAERAARGEEDEAGASSRRVGALGALAMVAFALLLVTAAVQTSRNAVSDADARRELAGQVSQARKELDADRGQVTSLQRETRLLQTQELRNDDSTKGLLSTIDSLGARAGTLAVQGPGVRVVADDAPGATSARNEVLDTDLQKLVNGFWEAGAEAIAVNGQRLTNLSTIRLAGGAITTNAHSLSPPYVVTVIGDKDTLPARFAETSSGQAWLDLQNEVGLRLSITPVNSLRLPATDVSLRYANQKPGGGS